MRISDWSSDVCSSDLLQLHTPISDCDSAGSVHDRLAELGAEVLRDGLALLRAGLRPQPTTQPEDGVTYAHKLDKAEARLDWSQPAVVLARKVRAFNPWPIAEAELAGERVRIHAAIALADSPSAPPGDVDRKRVVAGKGGAERVETGG